MESTLNSQIPIFYIIYPLKVKLLWIYSVKIQYRKFLTCELKRGIRVQMDPEELC